MAVAGGYPSIVFTKRTTVTANTIRDSRGKTEGSKRETQLGGEIRTGTVLRTGLTMASLEGREW